MNKVWFYDFAPTALGKLGIAESDGEISYVFFGEDDEPADSVAEETELTKRAAGQIREYLEGKRKKFELPLRLAGTDFQRAVWRTMMEIPYGETRSYKEVAERIGRPLAMRAVGNACNRNKIAIIIPCHRVVGSGGKAGGYAGGMERKEFLLGVETATAVCW